MTKTISTLVEDIHEVINGNGGWDETVAKFLSEEVYNVSLARLSKPSEPRGYLSMSSLGTDCDRKLWYKINMTESAAPLPASAKLKFFYGDILEALILALAMAAGHTVTGMQDTMEINGIKGHRDAVIDGVTIDVKSASTFSMKKFDGNLREDDPFGYISQLSSYVYAAQDDPLVTDKDGGAFLVIDKTLGHLVLDYYNFREGGELDGKEEEVSRIREMVGQELPPERGHEDVPQSKTSPNRKLPTACSYCDFKAACWPAAKMYLYGNGPVWLSRVVKEPKVPEITDWKDNGS